MSSFNAASRQLQTSTILTGALAVISVAHPALAAPTDGAVVGGQATINTVGTNTDINQASNRALIEWSKFDIGSNESVNFIQPGRDAIALNRVVGNLGASQIDGVLKANGNVIIVNSQGVMFGAGAQVNVGGIIATTADTDNNRFMNGELNFDKAGNPNATVRNDGSIKVADGGLALFVAPNVENNGLVQAKLGKVQLASGDTFAVDMYGDGLLSVQASKEITKQLVKNSGKIEASGGQVLLTAAAAQNAIENVINMDGLIQANSIGTKGGKVVLSGAKTTTLVGGTIETKGTNAGEKGGNISVTGKNVALLTGATLDASGDIGGGSVKVGGDFHGEGSTPTADNTVVQTGATIRANALTNGDGGDVAVWADNNTFFHGAIEAKGGAQSGNGGFVETSGKQYLEAFGLVDASAANGKGGTWLLDPNDITISNAADANVTGNPNFTTTNNSGVVSVASILANLNNSTSVIITTGNAGSPPNQGGNITVANDINKTLGGDATLTLNAHNNIVLNDGVTIGSTSNKLNVAFNSNSDNSGGGNISLGAGSNINSNGGNITLGGVNNLGSSAGSSWGVSIKGNLNAAGGNITIEGHGRQAATDANYGVFIENANSTIQTTGAGKITITGIGGGNGATSGTNHGIYFSANTAVITTQNGDITLTGTGGGTNNATSINNQGIGFVNGTNVINSTGSGKITLTGIAGGDQANTNYGITILNTTTTIGNVAATGAISLISDRLNVGGNTLTIKTLANVTLKTAGASGSIGVAGGAGALQLTNSLLDTITAGSITIGDTGLNGDITANARTWQAPVTFQTGAGNIAVNGNQTMGARAFNAKTITGNITVGAGAAITASGSNGNVLLSSFNGGKITMNTGSSITTTTGFIRLGGNGTIGGDNTGTIDLNGATLTAAGGNISLRGSGNTTSPASNNYGVAVHNSTIQNSGSGGVSLAGGGGGTGSNNYGLWIDNSTISLANGLLGVSGAGGGSNVAGSLNNYGVFINNNSTLSTTVGPIVISGSGGGDFTKASGNYGIKISGGTNTIGGASTTGIINILTNNIDVSNNLSIRTTSNVAITPTSGGTTGLAGAAGELELTTAILNSITAGSINIGLGSAGTITANAYSWNAPVTLETGAGDIVLNGVQTMGNRTFTAKTASGDIIIGASGGVSSTAANTAITLAASAGDFTNNGGAGALSAPNGRWLIYSTKPANNTLGGITSDFFRYSCTYGGACPAFPSTGNGLLYSSTPVITVTLTPDAAVTTYGEAAPTFTYTFSGYNPGDEAADVRTGAAVLSTNYNVGDSVGFYNIIADKGTLTSSLGYEFQGSTLTNGLTVNKATLNITAGNQNQTYGDGNFFTGGFTSNGLYAGDSIDTVDYATNAGLSTGGHWKAGTWTITASNATGALFDANNYNITYNTGTLNIAKKDLSITSATADNKVYDGTTIATNPILWTDNRAAGDTGLSYGFSDATFDTKDVGVNKTVTFNNLFVVGADTANYNLNPVATAKANITQATLLIDANDQTQTYGAGNFLTQGVAVNGLVAGESLGSVDLATNADANLSTSGNWKAGDYTITASNAQDNGAFLASNYAITYTTGDLHVGKKDITVTAVAQDKTYDGNRTATVSLSNDAIAGDLVDNNYTTARFGNKNAGTNKTVTVNGINISGADADNYNLLNTTTTDLADIFKRLLTITATADNKVYDGNRNATVTLSDDRVAGDTFTTETYNTARFGNKNVGTNKTVTVNGINISGGDANNYTFNTTATDLADITPAGMTITANNQSQVYGDGNILTNGYQITGLVAGETVGSVDLGTNADANKSTSGNWKAGSWAITASNASGGTFDAGNYSITYVDGTLNILQKNLTATVTAQDKVYDGNRNATVTFTNNTIAGDIVTDSYTTARFGNKNVGNNKTVTVNGITIGGADASNYILINTTATDKANITPASLTITANNQNQTYGDGNILTQGVSSVGLVAGESLGVVNLATDADSNLSTSGNWRAGNYTITASNAQNNGAFLTSNYTISYNTGSLAVAQKSLNVSATATDKVYDGNTTAAVALSDNRIGGDIFTDSYTTADFDTKDVGVNKTVTVNGISISGTDAANYIANGSTTDQADITQATLIITANNQNQTYGAGNNLTQGVAVNGLVAGESLGTVDLATDADLAGNKSTSGNWKAGDYTITASNAQNNGAFLASNYAISYVDGALHIAKKDITVSTVAQDKIYDGTRNATVSLSNDKIAGDVVNNSYSTALFDTKNVGTNKTVTVDGIAISGADADNYNLTSTTATDLARIFQRLLIVSATGVDKVYDGLTNATVTLSDNRVAGDVFTDNYGAANFLNKNVGNRVILVTGINISGTDAGNYLLVNPIALTSANITKASLIIDANNQSQIYGAGNVLTQGVTGTGLVNGETLGAVTLATDANLAGNKSTSGNWKAGDYTITASNAQNNGAFRTSNYAITYTTGDLHVSQKDLTVSALASNKVYDGTTDASAQVTLSNNAIPADVVNNSFTDANFNTKDVATANLVTVDGISISGADASNYNLTNTTATASANITAKTLFIDADDQTKVYGSADPTFTFASSGFVPGEDVSLLTGALDRDAGENVVGSPYAIHQGTLDAGSNYTIDYTGGNLTITPYTLSVSADNQTKIYGDADPALTYTFGALQNGDNASVFTGGLERDPGENVVGSPYIIHQGTLGAGSNYIISFTDGALTINPATLNVQGDNQFITLGDNIPNPLTFTATGFKFADGYGVFTGALSTVPRESLPGVYLINRGTLDANPNYIISYSPGIIIIGSPFANNTSEQLSDFVSFKGPAGPSTLLAMSNNPGGNTGGGAGGLGGLAPAAGGENPSDLGNLDPAAGGNAFALIQCDNNNPCDTVQ